MESSTPSLSIESFSHSWLVNLTPSNFESLDKSFSSSFDASDETSFIEMDPKLPASRRFSRVAKDFSFDFRSSQSPLILSDADELISDGFVMPLFGKPIMKMEPYDYYNYEDLESLSPRYNSSLAENEVHSSSRVRCASLRRCKRLSKRIFQKYLDFLKPLCQKLRWHGSGGSRVASISARVDQYSPATSPRTSVAWSADNWRRSCDSESSIYEAVLHCKRTYGK